MTVWVDTHCHLHMADSAAADLIARAQAANVEWLVCPGTDAAGSEAAAELATRFSGIVFATAGLHPHHADLWPKEQDRIGDLAAEAVAVGECGLDFYRDLSPRAAQRAAFREQLALAAALDKPVVVHCRDAFAEVFEDLEASGHADRAVLHCWTGGPRWTERFAALGVTFSFAGPITYPGGGTVRAAAAVVPPERTLVETDTPYLTPPPDRSRSNEPAKVVRVGEALAEVWGVTPGEVAGLTTATATRIFRD